MGPISLGRATATVDEGGAPNTPTCRTRCSCAPAARAFCSCSSFSWAEALLVWLCDRVAVSPCTFSFRELSESAALASERLSWSKERCSAPARISLSVTWRGGNRPKSGWLAAKDSAPCSARQGGREGWARGSPL